MKDFMLGKYQELCQTLLDCGYSIVTVFDWLNRGGAGHHDPSMVTGHNVVVVRHDVDRRPGNALGMAELEHAVAAVRYAARMKRVKLVLGNLVIS